MAVWGEVPLSKLAGARRVDAEYYDPQLLRYEYAVKKFSGGWAPLKELAELVTDGDHLKRNYVSDGVLFLTSENFREHTIEYASQLRIASDYERTLARARAEAGAVFLTKTGRWYGKAAVCRADEPRFNISADVAKIRIKDEYDPFFLACYLNSSIGYALVRRESTGASRDRIILDNLRTLPVPRVARTESKYRAVVDRIGNAYTKADRVYAEAEALLESALGLDKLDLTPWLFYKRSYLDVQKAGRCDAEYFSPRMQNLISALSCDGLTIANVAKISKRRFKPKPGAQFQYIEIADVTGSGTVDSSPVAGDEAPSRATWIVKPGDIITTTVRPIRRLSAIITDDQDGYICSSGFAVVTPRNPKDIAPELLLVYLRLPLVCELLDLHTTASMYPAISAADLMKIPIALPNIATRRKIVARVRESFDARREARRLLGQAKAIVEDAILGERSS
jgi:hypothetical protein